MWDNNYTPYRNSKWHSKKMFEILRSSFSLFLSIINIVSNGIVREPAKGSNAFFAKGETNTIEYINSMIKIEEILTQPL